jgi:hypothetical protein
MTTDKPTLRVARQSIDRFDVVRDRFNTRVYPHQQGVGRGCTKGRQSTMHCLSVFIRGWQFCLLQTSS